MRTIVLSAYIQGENETIITVIRADLFSHHFIITITRFNLKWKLTPFSVTRYSPAELPASWKSCTNSYLSPDMQIYLLLNVVKMVNQLSLATLNVQKKKKNFCLMKAASSTGGKPIWLMTSPRCHAHKTMGIDAVSQTSHNWKGLTLKWAGYFPSVGAQRGFHGTRLCKTTLPVEFCDEYYDIYLYTKNNIFKQKIPKIIYRFKMAAKWPIFISHHFNFDQNLKNHFPKQFFQWNLAHNRISWIH